MWCSWSDLQHDNMQSNPTQIFQSIHGKPFEWDFHGSITDYSQNEHIMNTEVIWLKWAGDEYFCLGDTNLLHCSLFVT